MASPSPSLSTLSPSAPSASSVPFFACAASEILQVCKALEAFRKGAQSLRGYGTSGLDADSLFFSSTGAGLIVQGFCSNHYQFKEAFYAWLPDATLSECGGFSLPFAPFASFVKATKGKGSLSYEKDRLSASSGASLSLEALPSLFESEAAEMQKPQREGHYLPAIAEKHLSDFAEGFPLLPFLTASRFASGDASKLVLCGAGFSGQAFYGIDGHLLRKAPAKLPAFPKAGAFPENAWLPAWLAPVIEALAKPAERSDLLAFYWPAKQNAQALRFFTPSGLLIALRFSEAPASFPACEQLIPKSLPFSFAVDRAALLAAVDQALQALKSSEGSPFVDLSFDAEGGSVLLSALLQKNIGTKKRPEMKDIGRQEASCFASFRKASEDPRFLPGFYEKPEQEREDAMRTFESQRRLCVNATFLQKAIRSFEKEGDRLLFQWKDDRSPFLLSAGFYACESLCLIMPVLKRR